MLPSNILVQRLKNGLPVDGRSKNLLKHVSLSFLFKGVNIGVQLALVPLTIHYLDKEKYGIWLTLSAVIGWFSFFDIGLGNGLRNKLAEAIAKDDIKQAKTFISTSYALLLLIFGTAIVLFLVINPFIDWTKVLNAPSELRSELSWVALIAFIFFCLRFIFNLIGNILYAIQKAALNTLVTTVGNVLSLFLIYLLQFLFKGSLLAVSVVLSAVPVLILIVTTVLLFASKFREFKPSLSFVDIRQSKDLMGLGYKFFVIQIAGIVLFSSSEVIITQMQGPAEVTAYNIAYRYFMVVTMVNGILITPFWSAFTDAYAKNDLLWIKKTVRKLNAISIVLCFIAAIMVVASQTVYSAWVGDSIVIPQSLSIAMGLFACFGVIVSPYNCFINGVGKIKLQYWSSIVSLVITIPLAIMFAKVFEATSVGVVLATLCTTIPCTFLWIIQYRKIVNNEAEGIWNA